MLGTQLVFSSLTERQPQTRVYQLGGGPKAKLGPHTTITLNADRSVTCRNERNGQMLGSFDRQEAAMLIRMARRYQHVSRSLVQ